MKVWGAIFNLIAVVLIAIMLVSFNKITAVNDRQFEQLRLSYAVDYATEAAFRSAISTDSIGTDYANGGMVEVEVNPTLVLDTFCSVLALSYDLSPSENNFIKIEQSIATGFLCTINGYYILEIVEQDNYTNDYNIGGDYRLSWGIKRPYLLYDNLHCLYCDANGVDHTRLFSVSLVNEKNSEYIPEGRYCFNCGDYGDASANDGSEYEPIKDRDTFEGTNLTRAKIKQAISKNLTEDINYAIHRRNLMSVYDEVRLFYVPSDDSMTAINDIESPSLAIIFQDSTFLNGYDMDVVSIGGVKVKPRTQVIGFRVQGDSTNTMYYCYAGQQLGDKFVTGETKPKIVEEGMFNTIHEAAQAGFSPHLMFLQEPYSKYESANEIE